MTHSHAAIRLGLKLKKISKAQAKILRDTLGITKLKVGYSKPTICWLCHDPIVETAEWFMMAEEICQKCDEGLGD